MAPIQVKEIVLSGASSFNVSFDSLPAIGNNIAVILAIWPQEEGDNVTCSDNQSHTPDKVMGTNATGSSGCSALAAWKYPVVNSSGTFTVSIAGINNVGSTTCQIIEMPGVYHLGSFDTTVPGPSSTASRAITTTQPDCELLAFMTPGQVANPVNVTEGGGFTLLEEHTDNNTANGLYTATRVVSSAGTYTPSWTYDSGSYDWLAGVLAFDIGASGQPIAKRIKTIPGMGRGFTGHFGAR